MDRENEAGLLRSGRARRQRAALYRRSASSTFSDQACPTVATPSDDKRLGSPSAGFDGSVWRLLKGLHLAIEHSEIT
jgi:hypothetical protein